MRRLIYALSTSLDGYIEGPDGSIDWGVPDDELFRHFVARAAFLTTELYGRRMWETMSSYWPAALHDPAQPPLRREFARLWNAGEHVVFSRTLRSVDHGARLVTGDAVEEVKRLKAGEGSDMDISGPDLASTLLAAGLVDEIHAYVHPVAIGGGKRFLPPGRFDLALIGVQTFSGGVVQLRYVQRR
jgi:dihydrofolate reductase